METYSRGQWGKDDDFSDDDVKWKGKFCDELDYKGFEEFREFTFGEQSGFNISVYCAEDIDGKYPFFAAISTGNRSFWYLVTDFPSVLMLTKEVLPIIVEQRDQEKHDAQMEEHEWLAKGTDKDLFRRQCAHVS